MSPPPLPYSWQFLEDFRLSLVGGLERWYGLAFLLTKGVRYDTTVMVLELKVDLGGIVSP